MYVQIQWTSKFNGRSKFNGHPEIKPFFICGYVLGHNYNLAHRDVVPKFGEGVA